MGYGKMEARAGIGGMGAWKDLTRVVCSPCAEDGGQVPFTTDEHGTRWQGEGWTWAPYMGGVCECCGKPSDWADKPGANLVHLSHCGATA